MKAIIMAGGEGTRLWPISEGRPKPMTELFGRPILAYTVDLLRKHGFTDIAMTLRHLPAVITDYFGDGSEFGVRIEYRLETTPLGTAGGVGACRDFAGDDDVLVISGDGVCDFDLAALFERHKSLGAEATIAVTRADDPTEYGLCLADGEGRVTGFREKPDWEDVVTDLVNTGIYVLSPAVFGLIPEGRACDFGKELFPNMLRQGRALYAIEAEGYWCDVGSPEAYRKCCMDFLSREGKGVLVDDSSLSAPSAHIAGSALCGGAVAESDSVITNSVVNGGRIRPGAVVSKSVICRGATVGEGAFVMDGCTVGAGARIGAGAVLYPNVRLAPGAVVGEGEWVRRDRLTGGAPEELTPSEALRLGFLLGSSGKCAVGWTGGHAAATVAHAIACGIRSAGGDCVAADSPYEAAHASACGFLGAKRGAFVRQKGGIVSVSWTGGAPRGQVRPVPPERFGALTAFDGVGRAYLSRLVSAGGGDGALTGVRARAVGKSKAGEALRQALAILGVSPQGGAAALELSEDGFTLTATDEGGVRLDHRRLEELSASEGDGAIVAVSLLKRLKREGITLHELVLASPAKTREERRISVSNAARKLGRLNAAFASELTPTGVRLTVPGAAATVRPTGDGQGLVIEAESDAPSAADELMRAIEDAVISE